MRELAEHEVRAFLFDGARTGKLATASPAGAVHAAPIWFVADAGPVIVFTTWHKTVKAANLRANPRAALVVDDERFPYAFVLVRGSVVMQEAAPDLLEWATAIARRYVPADRIDEYARRNAVPGEWLCRLHMDRVVAQADIAD
jgi:PPOX class probable F420-dependent enzyme